MRVRTYVAPLSVGVLALLSSIAGIVNQFTYDDRYIIQFNDVVHTLHRWWSLFGQSYWPKTWSGDGYRPLVMLAYAAEWVVGHGSPAVFHAVNIAVYVAVSLLVFRLGCELLPRWAAWVAAVLFAVHPVHVEAVANVVGQEELLVALGVVAATILYVRDRRRGDVRPATAAAIAACYAFACLAKEHGIVLPALLVAAELTVIDDARPLGERVRRLRPLYLALAAVAIAFVGVRSRVLADHDFAGCVPFTPFATLKISGLDRVLTAVMVVPQWIRLLLWPVHLAAEYGPPGLEIAQGFSLTELPGVLLLGAVLALGVVLRRRQPVASFGIAFTCVALLPSSNFILPAGILLAERTLFLPSVGAMLMVGALVAAAADRARAERPIERRTLWLARAGCGLVLAAGVARSALRTTVWRDNYIFFHHLVIDSPYAYRAHYMLGALHFEREEKAAGEAEYRRAMQLFPYDPALSFNMAEQYRHAGMCAEAIPFYRWTRQLDPDYPMGRTQYAECFLRLAQYDSAKTWIFAAIKAGGSMPVLHQMIVYASSAKRTASESGTARGSAAERGSKVPETVQKAAR